MRKLFSLLTLTLMLPLFALAGSGDEQAIKDVKKALQDLTTAFEKGDAGAIKMLTTADHLAVTVHYAGAIKRDEQIALLKELKYTEYKAGQMRVSLLGTDAALVTYPVTTKGTFKGKPLAYKGFVSSVWVKRDGRWLETLYQETALDAK